MRPELKKTIENGELHPPPIINDINLNRTHIAIIDRINSQEKKKWRIDGDWCIRLCRIQRDYKFKCERDAKGTLLFENTILPLSDLKLLNQISPEIKRVIDMRGQFNDTLHKLGFQNPEIDWSIDTHKQPYEITRKCPFCQEWFTSKDPRRIYCHKGHRKLYNRKVAAEEQQLENFDRSF